MLGFETLLLATDGSESAEAAIQEAINIAEVCSSRLFVISVVEVNPEYEALAPQVVEKAEKETREHLDSIRARAEKTGIVCEVIAHQGEEPFRFIVDEAKERKADMIVMGSHGRTGLKRLMMGSVTARVIGHAPCKVLVVPC
jgi:nucleotide-binding universal stress UspA family protein